MTLLADCEFGPLPPSVNHLWRTNGRAVYKTADAKKWQKHAAVQINADMRRRGIFKPYSGKVMVTLYLFTKTERRMDIDNRVKATLDCLAPAGAIVDDSQVWKLETQRIISKYGANYIRLIVQTLED
ncbi:MAG: RusA family crossover junction endodeoxyribonuclease [Synergistaceae bacterium]|nr:RusA family crossover junction endodeoxyribonuclease [Synergistaceae bacterium]